MVKIFQCLEDPRPVIRGTAVWSIGELTKKQPDQAIDLLYELQEKETDTDVLQELKETIMMLETRKKDM
ncbi:hypothetical protein TMUPMC115_1459 [Tetragenococcus muriaticus PMC-11-5]|uniref:HEAT repeat domain-containing protein n=1 Tax=Tetragenococcus muriaticus PMC-11-5 TaxID=1302649 RepID=A0A091C300_9ENTE|nr:hypothetical protein TMUPMC115_1459 [Tetragenococcus muriaticus PMC-11-5]